MKIYNEVIIDMNTGEVLYEDSEEWFGPVALCGEPGSDKNRAFDRRNMDDAASGLGEVLRQYKKNADPFNSFYANEIERMEKETSAKRVEAQDSFSLQRDQNQDQYQLSKTQGIRTYDEQVSSTQTDIKRIQQDSIAQVQDARAASADSTYASMTAGGAGGLAAAGGRGKKVLAARAKSGVGKVSMSLTAAKEQMDQKLRDAEIKQSQGLDEQALGIEQKNETAQLSMDQTRSGLDRDLTTFTDKMVQEQDSAMERLRTEARTIVSSTKNSFTDPHSEWGESNSSSWSPWKDKFDDADEELGIEGV